MTITVEDGTGLPNADAYVSVADADAYHAAQGSPTSWSSASTSAKEDGIRQATTYLDAKFARRWKGARSNELQALRWPRCNVIDLDGYLVDSKSIPARLEHATAELALKVVEGDVLLVDVANAGASTTKDRVKVGPIEVEEGFSDGSSGSQQIAFVKARALLADFLESTSLVERA